MDVTQTEETPSGRNAALVASVLLSFEDLELKRTRRPSNSDWSRMLSRRRKNQIKLVDDLKNGTISIDEFERYFTEGLRRTHINASVMGRQRAGDFADESEADELVGLSAAQADAGFYRAFFRDLRNGLYGSIRELDDVAVKRRSLLYINKARSTANQAFAQNSGDKLFDWVMMANEKHCTSCPTKAAGGPYDARQLGIIGYPAQGRDRCVVNCLCVLYREDGVASFGRVPNVNIPATPARQLVSA